LAKRKATTKSQRKPVDLKGPRQVVVRAKYDAAQITNENRKHWGNADHLSADSAMTHEVRRILRSNARYEVDNNSYAKGMVATLANDTIGTGPRLQLMHEDGEVNNRVELEFVHWMRAVNMPQKLRVMRMSKAATGEVFGVMQTNPRLTTPVQLDLRVLEGDHVCAPYQGDGGSIDGIYLDQFGNPERYRILRHHPGDGTVITLLDDAVEVDAGQVIHYFRAERPGQHRGIPEITPSLPLFAMLRRYRLAVLSAAETAANFAMAIFTTQPASEAAADLDPLDVFEIERNMAMVMPEGWQPAQIKAEQPTTNHVEYVRSIIAEIARCLNMPLNVALGDSSQYNYASGRLDHQVYHKAIRVERCHIELVILNRLFEAWLREAVLIEGYLPQEIRGTDIPEYHWFWDGFEHVDPGKEAKAQETRLLNNTTTLATEFAKQGLDWEVELGQRALELQRMRDLGIPLPGQPTTTTENEDVIEDE